MEHVLCANIADAGKELVLLLYVILVRVLLCRRFSGRDSEGGGGGEASMPG